MHLKSDFFVIKPVFILNLHSTFHVCEYVSPYIFQYFEIDVQSDLIGSWSQMKYWLHKVNLYERLSL